MEPAVDEEQEANRRRPVGVIRTPCLAPKDHENLTPLPGDAEAGCPAARCRRAAQEIIKHLVPDQDVEDVIQEVMLRYSKRGRWLPAPRSVHWTARVARNVSRAWHRERRKTRRVRCDSDAVEAVASGGARPGEERSDPPVAHELPPLLRWIEENANLTEKQKLVLWGHFGSGEGVRPLARKLKTNPKQIRRWIVIILRWARKLRGEGPPPPT
jgi:DNA-directed RNA polymerase specialized sigma24 family protein